MPELSKLPKWAQELFERTARERDDAQTALKDMLDSQSPSAVAYSELVSGGIGWVERYVQAHALEFRLANGKVRCRITDAGDLNLNATTSGLGEMFVRPLASNCFEICFRSERAAGVEQKGGAE